MISDLLLLATGLDVVIRALGRVEPKHARTEVTLQTAVGIALREAGLTYSREKHTSREDRPDFLVEVNGGPAQGGTLVALEVKIEGGVPEIERQLSRYLAAPHMSGAVLLTSRQRHTQVAEQLGGLPVVVVVRSAAFA